MNTLKQQIKEVADHANLTPRVAALIQNFFLEVASQEEKDELDEWMNESPANDRFFDMMLEANKDGTGAGSLSLLRKLVKKPKPKVNRWRKYTWRTVLALFVLVLVDHFIPSRPLSVLILGPLDTNFITDSVETRDESKTIWLSDSTRVDLLPHSKLGYPNNFFYYPRRVALTGSAKFYVPSSKEGPLGVGSGKVWMEIEEGVVTLLSEDGNIVVQKNTP